MLSLFSSECAFVAHSYFLLTGLHQNRNDKRRCVPSSERVRSTFKWISNKNVRKTVFLHKKKRKREKRGVTSISAFYWSDVTKLFQYFPLFSLKKRKYVGPLRSALWNPFISATTSMTYRIILWKNSSLSTTYNAFLTPFRVVCSKYYATNRGNKSWDEKSLFPLEEKINKWGKRDGKGEKLSVTSPWLFFFFTSLTKRGHKKSTRDDVKLRQHIHI